MIKYKIFVLFLFTISLFSINFVSAEKQKEWELLGKIIYLDPGHGGSDPGAMYKNIKEKDINLILCQKLSEKLEKKGAIVYMTRYGDYDLSENYTINHKRSDLSKRVHMINESEADLYLSIHLNAENSSSWKGIQVYYDDVKKENKTIADLFYKIFKKELSNVRENKLINNLYLLRRIQKPGVLIEVGFLSNPNDRYLLRQEEYQEKITNLFAKVITNYFLP